MYDKMPASRRAPALAPAPPAATTGTGAAGSRPRPHRGASSRGRWTVAVLALAAALAGGAGCTDPGLAGGSTTSDPSASDTTAAAPATTPPSPEVPPPVAVPVPVPEVEAGAAGTAALVDLLVVAPEADGDGYERELFGSGWIDADGDGCDTRKEVLVAESITPAQVDAFGCGIVAGDWLSSYDGYETTDPTELEIDHVVALAEAWRSGASGWDDATRRAFANDLDEPLALIAVSETTNRSKSDRDPAEWQPPSPASWCGFVEAWATVKVRWALTADQPEVDALRNMLASC